MWQVIVISHFLLVPAPSSSLYVVGAIEEALPIRGFRYHPIDLEASVIRSHKSICGW